MARKARVSDLQPGKPIHYWGKNYRVWSNDGENVTLVIPGETPNAQYQPYPAGMQFSTSVVVSVDNEFLLCFDEIKRNAFGREIK